MPCPNEATKAVSSSSGFQVRLTRGTVSLSRCCQPPRPRSNVIGEGDKSAKQRAVSSHHSSRFCHKFTTHFFSAFQHMMMRRRRRPRELSGPPPDRTETRLFHEQVFIGHDRRFNWTCPEACGDEDFREWRACRMACCQSTGGESNALVPTPYRKGKVGTLVCVSVAFSNPICQCLS